MRYTEIIAELDFKGSACSVDCSGHEAGYNWAKRNPGKPCNSRSPSFNKGCEIAKKEPENSETESQNFAGSYPAGKKGQAKGRAKMPRAKKGRKRHPLQGKLVGGS